MNNVHDLPRRQKATRSILITELEALQRGFNPILNKFCPVAAPAGRVKYKIHPNTPFLEAIWQAFELSNRKAESRRDLKSSLNFIAKSIKALKLGDKPVSEIKRRHILSVLEGCANIKTTFNDR